MKIKFLSIILIAIFAVSCGQKRQSESESTQKYYVRMADSEMQRFPQAWQLDSVKSPKWNYTQGLVLQAIYDAFKATGEPKYRDYVVSYEDTMLFDGGHKIRTYSTEKYNIDHVNTGKVLFDLYADTQDSVYLNALQLLRFQMTTHPRTSKGGFWHKQIYSHQMWLDGIYMASPFLAEYATVFGDTALYSDVVHQITLIAKHTFDAKTGLYYHGFDESREQKWANKTTGTSPNFWSRSMGWYMMAMVDALDYLPENQAGRDSVIAILRNLSAALEVFRDSETGMWYQVTDKIGQAGNYVEASGSIMFIYAWTKGAQKGYLDKNYLEKARTAYEQFLKTFVIENADGTISITKCCAVAGLGGNPYRDGSYEYYINEPIIHDDLKAVGPFIMTSILLDK
ncbi:MAG: glycoside hydrolase family 88 protein [Prevotellaceae bacterium]|jgi:unsaturated rhamnogalacturonyl hydrolase|nr:glycoside hydrolase family 88 protein [Prevotellaceae bacterium]